MLSTMRSSWLLFALFALVALSSALNIGDINLDGIEEYLNHGVKRQAQGTGNTNTNTQKTTSAPPPTTTADPTTTDAPPSTPAPSSQPAPTTTPPTTNPPSTSNRDQTTTPAATTSPTSSSTSKAPISTTETTPLVSTSEQVFTTIFTTKSNGQDVIQSSTGTSKILTTTGQATVTKAIEGQSAGGGGGGSSGLTSKEKSIVGGVVGGVGGVLLLGGIALVCWRIWGRKNRVNEDDADLMAGTGSALGDKSHNTHQSPFQSNLEQYHNGTGGRPNAAANF